MKKQNYYFMLALLFYILPVVLFGDIYNITNIVVFIISILGISFFVNYKSLEDKEWPTYFYCFLHGASISLLGLSVFGIKVENPMISISVNLQSIPAIVSIIGFVLFAKMYRVRKRLEYLKQFEGNNISLNRDQKINQIINSWFN